MPTAIHTTMSPPMTRHHTHLPMPSTVFVASADDFYEQPQVANGATKLLGEEIGMNVLPGNLPIEIEVIFELCE